MKQIIFATSNQSKSKRFSKGLKELGIEVLSLKDIDVKLDVEEDGKAFVKIPSVDETSTADDVVNLLNTSTLILNGNA